MDYKHRADKEQNSIYLNTNKKNQKWRKQYERFMHKNEYKIPFLIAKYVDKKSLM